MKRRWILLGTVFYLSFILEMLYLQDIAFIIIFYISVGLLGFYHTVSHQRLRGIISFLFVILSIQVPPLLFILPIVVFGMAFEISAYQLSLVLLPLIFTEEDLRCRTLIFLAAGITYAIKYLLKFLEDLELKYFRLYDESTEKTMSMELKHQELIEHRNYELQNAILTERNRIARDIHDNIGHLLTRSILQIGALKLLITDDRMKEELNSLGSTMNIAMDEVRRNVHNIHAESVELDVEVRHLIQDFDHCRLHYENLIRTEMTQDIVLAMIFVVKEALTNISKHSDASDVQIRFFELPKIFYFLIADNGTVPSLSAPTEGIGLSSMRKRIEEIGGRLHLNMEQGFRIFIQIPKEGE